MKVSLMDEIKVVKKNEAKSFMEGDEHCRLYVKTDMIIFGTSSLLPGKRGDVDPGHKKSEEIFYVAKGRVICHLPKKKVYKELEEGDIIVIPLGEPHQIINPSNEEATVCWSMAPPE
jgi:mannose-6-phosphate isomerase-like protein (cupin superfamily)